MALPTRRPVLVDPAVVAPVPVVPDPPLARVVRPAQFRAMLPTTRPVVLYPPVVPPAGPAPVTPSPAPAPAPAPAPVVRAPGQPVEDDALARFDMKLPQWLSDDFEDLARSRKMSKSELARQLFATAVLRAAVGVPLGSRARGRARTHAQWEAFMMGAGPDPRTVDEFGRPLPEQG